MNVRINKLYLLSGTLLVIFVFFYFSLPYLIARHQFEKKNNRYEICLEYREIVRLSEIEELPVRTILEAFRDTGVSSVAIFQDTVDSIDDSRVIFNPSGRFDNNVLPLIARSGLRVLARPVNPQYCEGRVWEDRLHKDIPRAADMFLAAGDEAYGYPGKVAQTAAVLKEKNIRPVWLEFGAQKGAQAMARRYVSSSIKAHSVDSNEMVRIPDRSKLIARFVRAVRERGVRLVYVHLLPESGFEGNKTFISRIVSQLQKANFFPGEPVKYELDNSYNRVLRQLSASGISLCLPLISMGIGLMCMVIVKFPLRWAVAFVMTNIVGLMGGLIVASVLSIPEFMSGLYIFRGVKVAYLLPLFLFGFIVFRMDAFPHFWHRTVTGKEFLIICLGCLGIIVLLARSGNYTLFNITHGLEERMRFLLEQYLYVRPRTKEFLIAQPALLYAFWLFAKSPGERITGKPMFVRCMVCLGIIGHISIVNTFLHAHAPLNVSVIRTLHGIWIGAILGSILILITIAGNRLIKRFI